MFSNISPSLRVAVSVLADRAIASEPRNAEYWDTFAHLLLEEAKALHLIEFEIEMKATAEMRARAEIGARADQRFSDIERIQALALYEPQLRMRYERLRGEQGLSAQQLWDRAVSAHERSLQLGGTRDPICRYDEELFAKTSWPPTHKKGLLR